jgi:signal peptidase
VPFLALAGVVALVWFVWLRPPALGGATSYVIVQGTSMQPTFQDGDLVLAHAQSSYRRGDIIVFRVAGRFRDPAMVIHRIVGGSPTKGFVTRGDNRDRTDPWRPKPANVIGQASFALPFVGRVAETVRQPWFLAMLGVMAVVADGSRRRRHRRAVLRRRRALEPEPIAWFPRGEQR